MPSPAAAYEQCTQWSPDCDTALPLKEKPQAQEPEYGDGEYDYEYDEDTYGGDYGPDDIYDYDSVSR